MTESPGIYEFLLARIADKEALARRVDEDIPSLTVLGGRTVDPEARMLAECEAVRRIVERHAEGDDCGYWDVANCPDMRDLASVDADHPDFREEWRA